MKHSATTRRKFITMGAAGAALFASGYYTGLNRSNTERRLGPAFASLENLGALRPPDQNGIRLPPGFKSRVVARSGEQPASGSDYIWHRAPDGGACYETNDGGWIYVSNSEVRDGAGGVGALRFNASGEVVDAYSILANTSINCAGGKTPWQTWLSCEEHDRGQVFECDPYGKHESVVLPALGTFKHEAVAVDTIHQHLFLTEDKPDGALYRFRPQNSFPDLSSGTLELAVQEERDGRSWLHWVPVPDPWAHEEDTRKQVAGAARFNGGEGIAFYRQRIYFTSKGDNRVWWYDVMTQELGLMYDHASSEYPILSGVDNVAITASGDVLIAEDLGDMQIVVLTPGNKVIPLLQIVGHASSEITGPAFSPDHQRLYFSSQRGSQGRADAGITFEVSSVTLVG